MNKKTKRISIIIPILLLFMTSILAGVRCDIPVEELKAKYGKPDSRFMELRGMNVHYVDEGKGFPLVLVHGTGASLHTWDVWAQKLSPRYRVIRMDIPAYGLTGPDPNHDYSPDAYASFLREFLGKLGVQKCHMAGNSLGGGITWYFAATYPEMVSRIILIDAAGYLKYKNPPLVFRLARMPLLSSLARYVTPRYLVKRSMLDVYGDDEKVTPELVDRYYEMALREGNREAFIVRSRTISLYDTEKVKLVKAPTLIMWGSAATWIPPKYARDFMRDLQNSRLIMYEGVGHVPMEEIPEKTADDAAAFLQGN